jgi:hypothetical protein
MLIQKHSKIIVFSAILAASLGFGIARSWAEGGVVSKDVVSATALDQGNSYCNLKFPAIEPSSLGSDHPVLQSADTGDMIDYYGPCDHDPLGKEEVAKQQQDEQLYLDKGYDGE